MSSDTYTWYDRATKDVRVVVGGEYVGSRANRIDAEELKRSEQRKLDRQVERMKAVRN